VRDPEQVNALITAALKASHRKRRHPTDVTADRLAEHVEQYHARLSPADRDEFGHVIYLLRTIAGDE
jgi:hypothetical protein